MQFKRVTVFLSIGALVAPGSFAQTTISSNKSGKQGDYHYEYWKDNGTGTMTLGEGCDFSCQWGSVNNILFRKGVRPGKRDQVVTYTADYKPTGNSYLSVYGWFQNPLVEYYIIESWGTWKPPGVASKGTLETDSGTYDIYQNSRTGPSIEGNKTFQQYWSVRKTKRTSGTITCANHFNAWEKKGMQIGKMYEVSFNVEAYQSGGGNADVKVKMYTGTGIVDNPGIGKNGSVTAAAPRKNGLQNFIVNSTSSRTITFNVPVEGHASVKIYNCLGREVASLGERVYTAGQHSVTLNATGIPNGVYYYSVKVNQ